MACHCQHSSALQFWSWICLRFVLSAAQLQISRAPVKPHLHFFITTVVGGALLQTFFKNHTDPMYPCLLSLFQGGRWMVVWKLTERASESYKMWIWNEFQTWLSYVLPWFDHMDEKIEWSTLFHQSWSLQLRNIFTSLYLDDIKELQNSSISKGSLFV